MTDETTPAPGAESSTPPPAPEQRSKEPETGWPATTPPPSWADVEEPDDASDEAELDAWLDAQESGWPQDEPSPTATAPEPEAEPVAEPAEAEADEPAAEAEDEHARPEAAAVAPVTGAEEAEPDEAAAVDEPVTEVEDAEPEEPAAAVVEPATEAADGGEPVVEPEEHGSDRDAAELAGAALFAPVPSDVVAPAEPTPAAETPEPAAGPVPEADGADGAAGAAVPGERPATAVLALLAALVLVLAGLTGFLAERSVSTRGGGGVEDARHDGLQAARNAARVVFSYDYRHLDKDFAAGKALTTGAFADQYGTTTPKLVEVAKTYQAVVIADVSDAAVISASTGKVVVLVFVNQQSSSTLASAPKITQSRVTMTMQHRHGRWLVSDVHAF